MTYRWNRAAPGLYYLWDRTRKVHIASVKGSTRNGIIGSIQLAGWEWADTPRTNHAGMIALIEAEIREKQPTATFHRDNF